MNITSPKEMKALLDRHGFNFTKSLGQNFLIDQNIVEKIVRQGQIQGENVVEIGPGIGTLTREMAKEANKVLAIEIDQKLSPLLEETIGEFQNTKVIFQDILKTDIEKVTREYFNGHPFKVVANLPYYITSPILIYLLKSNANISEIIVMMQREVADRIVATNGNKEYGSISVFLKYFGDSKILMNVPNTVFMPKPKVGSSVIRLQVKKEKRQEKVEDIEKILRAAFGKRRKTILNSLSTGLNLEKDYIRKVLEDLNISENSRAENLTLDDYLSLTNKIINREN